ncbi:MAG: SAM-dependent methyltransferase [Oscillospiraceae bacterium]|nr:SAM-dependent methyltransferase [Oscillospiraceae bacterium]
MSEINSYLDTIFGDNPSKIIISKPPKDAEYRKVCVLKKSGGYQLEKYTEKQVFHENLSAGEAAARCADFFGEGYGQLNAWGENCEFALSVTTKGKVLFNKKKTAAVDVPAEQTHNRKKNYIIPEDKPFPALVDMGVFTKDGKVAKPMYDKFRQINRFTEIIDDAVREKGLSGKKLKIVDFGCGKSYLTFVLYHYFTEILGSEVDMLGLDLKADVIEKCNAAAKRYGYENLRFEMGDISGASVQGKVDMVVTLHACDTATDYALHNAIMRNADMIFSVPCCQHELNSQMKSDKLSLLTRYGIIKERTAALCTDAIRANLLEYCGYRTQLLEFVDFEHTPKNILIRAVKRSGNPRGREQYLTEAENLMKEFSFEPMLYKLLKESGKIG